MQGGRVWKPCAWKLGRLQPCLLYAEKRQQLNVINLNHLYWIICFLQFKTFILDKFYWLSKRVTFQLNRSLLAGPMGSLQLCVTYCNQMCFFIRPIFIVNFYPSDNYCQYLSVWYLLSIFILLSMSLVILHACKELI